MVPDMSEIQIDLNRVITDSAYRRQVIERLRESRAAEERSAKISEPQSEDKN
jgi:hypothetical protein